jgi:hypothetical protein
MAYRRAIEDRAELRRLESEFDDIPRQIATNYLNIALARIEIARSQTNRVAVTIGFLSKNTPMPIFNIATSNVSHHRRSLLIFANAANSSIAPTTIKRIDAINTKVTRVNAGQNSAIRPNNALDIPVSRIIHQISLVNFFALLNILLPPLVIYP